MQRLRPEDMSLCRVHPGSMRARLVSNSGNVLRSAKYKASNRCMLSHRQIRPLLPQPWCSCPHWPPSLGRRPSLVSLACDWGRHDVTVAWSLEPCLGCAQDSSTLHGQQGTRYRPAAAVPRRTKYMYRTRPSHVPPTCQHATSPATPWKYLATSEPLTSSRRRPEARVGCRRHHSHSTNYAYLRHFSRASCQYGHLAGRQFHSSVCRVPCLFPPGIVLTWKLDLPRASVSTSRL